MADLFDTLPPNVRTSDPETSHAASKRIEPKRGTHAASVLATLRYYTAGLTAKEMEAYTKIPGAWKRMSDLKALGLIVGTGETREGSEVYVAAP